MDWISLQNQQPQHGEKVWAKTPFGPVACEYVKGKDSQGIEFGRFLSNRSKMALPGPVYFWSTWETVY